MQFLGELDTNFRNAVRARINPFARGIPDNEDVAMEKFRYNEQDYPIARETAGKPKQMTQDEERFWEKQNETPIMDETVDDKPDDVPEVKTEIPKAKPSEPVKHTGAAEPITLKPSDYSVEEAKTFKDKWKEFWKSKPLKKRGVEKIKDWFQKIKSNNTGLLKKIKDERQDKMEKEHHFPEHMFADNRIWRGASYLFGNITKKSRLPGTDGLGDIAKKSKLEEPNLKRPLSLKVERAELYKRFKKSSNKEEKIEIVEEAREWDRIYVDYLTKQQEVRVDMGEMGEQMSEYVILEPKVKSDKPILVLVPGVSNDVNLEELSIQYAKKGIQVMVIGYPESWKGSVTKEFGDEVGESDNFGPHTEFIKKAINQILGENALIDVLGVSAGSLIVANLVADKDVNKRINNATMIVPPGAITHKFLELDWRLEAFLSIFAGTKKLGRLSAAPRVKIKTTQEHRDLMLHTFNALKRKLGQKYPWWEKEMYTGTGNKTLVIIGERDLITKAKKEKEAMSNSKSLTLVSFKKENHSMPATKSKELVSLIDYVQKKLAA